MHLVACVDRADFTGPSTRRVDDCLGDGHTATTLRTAPGLMDTSEHDHEHPPALHGAPTKPSTPLMGRGRRSLPPRTHRPHRLPVHTGVWGRRPARRDSTASLATSAVVFVTAADRSTGPNHREHRGLSVEHATDRDQRASVGIVVCRLEFL